MEKLFLGVAREIITPEIGCQLYGYLPTVFSESVEDDLTVTSFYFEQGDARALMLSVTVCLIETKLSQQILQLIEDTYGIPKEHCMLSATHTHSGPNVAGAVGWGGIDRKYCDEIFIPRILACVGQAIAAKQPVKMGMASGDSFAGVNRREVNAENHILLGQNPWGCFDPKMTILSFINEKEEPVANLIHYGMHGTAAGLNHEISRDWSGIMTDALEKQSGAITAFFNGPEGDIGPRLTNKQTVGDMTYVREIGAVAANDAVRIYRTIFGHRDVELLVSETTLAIPLKKRMTLEEATKRRDLYGSEAHNLEGMVYGHMCDVIESYEKGIEDKENYDISQTLIGLGDVVFAAFPFELFSEIGLRINQGVKKKAVLSLSNTNGSEGYFVTEDAICRGGYEVDMFLYGRLQEFVDNADYYMFRESVAHIQKMIQE